MSNAKVLELIKKYEACDYMQKLADTKMEKLVLFSVFPKTYAPNISDPHYFVMIKNVEKLIDFKKVNLN